MKPCSARSVCIDSVCRCTRTLIQHRMRCVKKVDLFSTTAPQTSCKIAKNCSNGLTCFRGKCVCHPPNFWNGRICHRHDLRLDNRKDAEAFSNRLAKKSGMQTVQKVKRSSDSIECWPDQYICSNGKGICLNQTCHCLDGYYKINDRCEKRYLQVNSSCAGSSIECQPNAICLQGKCVCTDIGKCSEMEEEAVNNEVKDRQFCLTDDDCGEGASCINSFCECTHGLIKRVIYCILLQNLVLLKICR